MYTHPMIRAAALAVLLVFSAGAALAQFRHIPPASKRGTIQHVAGMQVSIDGTTMQLAAGAQIRDANNLIVIPTALPPGTLVKYTVDAAGNVFRVWILSAQEATQPDPPPQ